MIRAVGGAPCHPVSSVGILLGGVGLQRLAAGLALGLQFVSSPTELSSQVSHLLFHTSLRLPLVMGAVGILSALMAAGRGVLWLPLFGFVANVVYLLSGFIGPRFIEAMSAQ